jgi:hypothetical protein
MRKTVTLVRKAVYLLLTEMIAVYLIAFPVSAFQVSSSSTGYVRVASHTSQLAYIAGQRASLLSTLAPVITAPTVASVAIRLVTGPVGWTTLGVAAAITLAQMYYTAAEIQSLQDATHQAGGWGYTHNGVTTQFAQNHIVVNDADIPGHPGNHCTGDSIRGEPNVFTPPQGITGVTLHPAFRWSDGWWWCPNGSGSVSALPAGPATLAQVQAYLNTLPSSDPQSIESNTQSVGQDQTATPADNVTTIQVTPTDIPTTVKPATQVTGTDSVVDPNAPAPAGPQPAVPSTQTTTTTTTTTTNSDGSVTKQEETTGSVSCSAGNHDQRTFGSVLQDHMTVWQSSGLLSALNVLKTLTWPSAIPTYSLSSSLFGSFTLDFSAWSGLLTALRSLIIALAAFVAYRIIFVGNA